MVFVAVKYCTIVSCSSKTSTTDVVLRVTTVTVNCKLPDSFDKLKK